jgi:protein ImuB
MCRKGPEIAAPTPHPGPPPQGGREKSGFDKAPLPPKGPPSPSWGGVGGGGLPRPVLLLDRPEPVDAIAAVPDGPPVRFTWRRVARPVVRAEGPERIAPEWWRDGARGASAPATTM